MADEQDEKVRYDVLIDAKSAISGLQALSKTVESSQERIRKFSALVLDASRKWGVSWQYALNVFKQLNAELSKQKKATLFGNTGGQDVFKLSEQYIRAAEAGNRYVTNANMANTATKNFDGTTKKAAKSVNELAAAKDKASKSADTFIQRLLSMQNLIRTAFGTFLAMAIFRLTQFVEESLQRAVANVRELELAFYRLANAERILSQQGVEISMDDLKGIVKEIKDMFPILATKDANEMVSNIALFTKELGLSKDQIESVSKAIVTLSMRSGLPIEQVQSQVLTALLTGRSQGIRDLGVAVTDALIKEKALELGLIKTAEEFNNLDGEAKLHVQTMATLALINESVIEEQKNLSEYMQTTDATLKDISSDWDDILTSLGEGFGPFLIASLPIMKAFLDFLMDAVNGLKLLAAIATMAMGTLNAVFSNLLKGQQMSLEEIAKVRKDILGTALADLFPEIPDDAPDSIREMIEEYSESVDTATDKTKGLADAIGSLGDNEKITNLMDDFQQDMERLGERVEDVQEDFQIDQARKLQDHILDKRRKEQDYQTERRRVIEDANNRIKDINQKYHEREANAEAKFQEQMRQLREKYLFNLEDALRERDARQVLRLQRQYEMDKQALINENALRKKEADQQRAEEAAAAREDLAQKLARMDEEHALEMQRLEEDYQLKKARDEENYARELEQLREQMDKRLHEIADALAKELGLNEQAAEEIYSILNSYYGPGGFFDGLYDYSYGSMEARAALMLQQIALLAQAMQNAMSAINAPLPLSGISDNASGSSSTGGTSVQPPKKKGHIATPRADGGLFFANTPTTATFGERGPEFAAFLPMGGLGNLGNLTLPETAGGGKVNILLTLSPDLEARITENTLDRAGQIVAQINRSKS